MLKQDHFLVFSKELYQEIPVPKIIFIVDIMCTELAPPFGNQSQRDSVYEQIRQVVLLHAWM